MRQFICMKWGSLYGADYVNRLYAMIRANTTGDIRVVCLTDDKSGIRDEVESLPCPEIDLPMPYKNWPWRKISLFGSSDDLYGLEGDWLYLDLDLVVTGNLDDFFTYLPEKSFVVMYNWTRPGRNIGNTSCYRFRIGSDQYIKDNLLASPEELIDTYRNSQTYISRNIKDLNFWPDAWCLLFKVHSVPSWPARLWMQPKKPAGSKVIAFPGEPNPHEALVGNWPEKKAYKRLYKTIRPTRWIQTIWDESEAFCDQQQKLSGR